ncbi:MAG: hypothetical protein ABI947_11805 [Chloroflexota bacterium]
MARLLRYPLLGWLCCDSRYMHAPCAYFNQKEYIQGLQANGFDGEEIASQECRLVVINKGTPIGRDSLCWNGQNAMSAQDFPNCFLADSIA